VKGRYHAIAAEARSLLDRIRAAGNDYIIEFSLYDAPLISVIIPAFNNINYTLACLTALKKNTGSLPYEVIVVDDASDDGTKLLSDRVSGIRYLRNESNLGFVRACNEGARIASGRYLVFLNNDAMVMEGWLDEILNTFRSRPDAGLVGGKLIYPDGRLQEAGGIVWRDGAAWNYGHGDDPARPEYNYLREVDYCSGACLAVPKELFSALNGFDEFYRPAYFEDTDLAMRVRGAGKKVYYQPLSMVIHFEGTTSGTDTSRGVKSYQVTNKDKFYERWKDVLGRHRPYNTMIEFEKERDVKKRVLFVDATTVTPDQDAGSVLVFNYMKIFMEMGYKVTFAPSHLAYDSVYTPELQRVGIECLYTPYVASIKTYLKKNGGCFDVIFLARADIADLHIESVKRFCPRAFVIFDTEDLHFLREMREIALRSVEKRRAQELSIMGKADLTIVTSQSEYQLLKDEIPGRKIENINPPWEVPGAGRKFEERRDIAFIGGFRHPPNVDAVKYFIRKIYPEIKKKIPGICCYIIGSRVTAEILGMASEDIIVTGYVKDLSEYLNTLRLTVVPLRFGSGVKGKIITSLGYGVPVVSTSMGAEGMGLENGKDILIADDPAEFASAVERLYTDRSLWYRLSENGVEKIKKEYSLDSARKRLEILIQKHFSQ